MKKTNLAKNTILLSAGTFLNKGLMFLMVPFFSRWLSTEDYGIFDVFTTYVSLLIPFITLACSDAIFRLSLDRNSEEGKSYYISNGILIVLTNSLLVLVLLTIWKFFLGFDHFGAFTLLLISEVMDNYFQGYLRAIKKLDMYALSKSVGTILIAILVTLFVRFLNMGLDGILLGYALGYLVTDIFIVVTTKYIRFFSLKQFSKNGVRDLITYSVLLIPNNISWWIINVSDRSIINFFLGAAANGIYAIAYKIPNVCSAVFSVFNISWQESASEMVNDNDKNKYFQDVYTKMFNVLISLCGSMVSFNFILFDWVFDVKYSNARFYAPILVSAIIFSSLSQFFGGIQISLKRPKENGITTVIGAVVNLIVHLGLIKFVGLYAAALSTIISNIAVMVMRQIKLRDTIVIKFKKSNVIYSVIYIYLFICCYLYKNIIWNLINLLISVIIFLIINHEYIKKIFGRFRSK